ncbi:MAG TPA: Ig-like domain-containing protein [Puia sp.]|nr:Ig-like domain-containing protein [Puia sp.]
MLSALVIGLLFIAGAPFRGVATPGIPHSGTDKPSAFDTYTITIIKDYSIINDQPDIIQVNVSPTPANPPGLALTFSIQGSTYTPTIYTDASGNAVLQFSGVNTGPVLVTIYRGQNTTGPVIGTVTVNFIAAPGPVDPTKSYISVVHSPETANGTNQDIVKAHLVDIYGNLMYNTNVDFSIASGVASFAAGPTVTTDDASGANPGEAQAKLVSTTVGDVHVTATVGGVTIGNGAGGTDVTVQFVVGAPDPSKSLLSVVHSPETANGTSQDVVKAHIVDANNHPVANATVTFAIYSGTGQFVGNATVTTDANGDVTIPIVSTVAGDVQIQAQVNGTSISNGVGGTTVTVQFVSDAPSTSSSYIAVVHSPETANGTNQDLVKVHLADPNGNLVGGAWVTFSIYSGTGQFVGTATVQTGDAASGHFGEATIPIVSTVAGDVVIQCVLTSTTIYFSNNTDGGKSVTVQFVSDVPDPSKSYIAVVTSPAAADGVAQDVVKVHLVDANGNPAVGTVSFSIYSGTGQFVGTSTLTTGGPTSATPGEVTIPIVSTVVGDVVIQCIYGSFTLNNNTDGGNSVTVQFVAGPPDASKSLLSVVQSPATADGVSQDVVKVHLVDASGNPASGTVTFSILSGTGQFVGSVTVNVTGDYTIPLVSTVAGDVVVQAKLSDGTFVSNGSGGNSVTVQFVAGAAVPSAPGAPSDPNAPGGTTGTQLSIVKNYAAADGAATDIVNAHITDAYGNPVKNEVVTFSIRTGGTSTGTAQLVGTVTVTTDANGDAKMSITNTVAGTVWIDATIDYNGNPTSLIDGSYKEVTFVNEPDVNNPETRLIVVVYEALADGQSTTVVKAHVVDQNGTVLPGQDVTFSIDSGSATIVTPQPVTTDANGDAIIEISSTKPGFVLITATVGGKSIKFGSPARVKFAAINIYVPKVFTPNGDGTNDLLKPILVGIAEFHYFNIYNRWGNLIFTTRDPNQGWDGTFKGVAQPVETYLWIAEGVDINGKKIVAKGMTSLVR